MPSAATSWARSLRMAEGQRRRSREGRGGQTAPASARPSPLSLPYGWSRLRKVCRHRAIPRRACCNVSAHHAGRTGRISGPTLSHSSGLSEARQERPSDRNSDRRNSLEDDRRGCPRRRPGNDTCCRRCCCASVSCCGERHPRQRRGVALLPVDRHECRPTAAPLDEGAPHRS